MKGIRYFSKPFVKLIGQTEINEDKVKECEKHWKMPILPSIIDDDVDRLPEIGGRLCYLSFKKKRPAKEGKTLNETYLDHIKEVQHTSVLEHSVFHFMIMDVGRNCTHEMVRHRAGWSYSQLSTRFVDQFSNEYFDDEKMNVGVYMPPEFANDPTMREIYENLWESAQSAYIGAFNWLISKGYKLKDARSIARECLPGSAGTAIMITTNATALRHFFRRRGAPDADYQIRRVALAMYEQVKMYNVFSDVTLVKEDE